MTMHVYVCLIMTIHCKEKSCLKTTQEGFATVKPSRTGLLSLQKYTIKLRFVYSMLVSIQGFDGLLSKIYFTMNSEAIQIVKVFLWQSIYRGFLIIFSIVAWLAPNECQKVSYPSIPPCHCPLPRPFIYNKTTCTYKLLNVEC